MINYNTQNWKECLESLGFTEVKNDSFGGIMILDDKGVPQWQYDTEEEKKIAAQTASELAEENTPTEPDTGNLPVPPTGAGDKLTPNDLEPKIDKNLSKEPEIKTDIPLEDQLGGGLDIPKKPQKVNPPKIDYDGNQGSSRINFEEDGGLLPPE